MAEIDIIQNGEKEKIVFTKDFHSCTASDIFLILFLLLILFSGNLHTLSVRVRALPVALQRVFPVSVPERTQKVNSNAIGRARIGDATQSVEDDASRCCRANTSMPAEVRCCEKYHWNFIAIVCR